MVTLRFALLGSERYPDMLRRRKEDAYGDRSAPQSPSSDVMVLLEDGTEDGIFVRDSGAHARRFGRGQLISVCEAFFEVKIDSPAFTRRPIQTVG